MDVGDVLDDRFVVEELASRGGLGVVFRGWDLERERAIAIKVLAELSATDIQRFHREAALLAELRLPGIVEFVATGRASDGAPYLVMEWLAGETLAGRLERSGLEVREAVELARAVVIPLAAMHDRGLVHRDIKPENLVVGERAADVRLIDLGLARAEVAQARITATGVVLGTPGYMAPEQIRGEAIDARVDVFALGCVLYECLTGYAAFSGDNYLAVRSKVLLSAPPPLPALCPEVPGDLERLVTAMIAKAPAQRPAHAGEVGAVLAALGPLPVGPRRRWNAPRPPTLPTVRGGPAARETATDCTGVVLVETALPEDLAAIAALRVAAAREGATLEVMASGAVVASIRATAIETVAPRIARTALALRALLPSAPIAIGSGLGEVDALFDQTASMLEHAVRATIFGGAAAVVVDEPTAVALGDAFALERRADGWRLLGAT
jgi:hypothetical protein